MKLSKEEIIQKINDKVMDEDVKVELMEDVTDSFEVETETDSEDKKRAEELQEKYDNLLEKYKQRFLKGEEKEETEESEEKKDVEEYEEKEIIDVKEI